MDLRLTDTVVLVTGASRGLGAAMAVALAREGAHVVAAARSVASLEEVASLGEGRITTLEADMRDEDVRRPRRARGARAARPHRRPDQQRRHRSRGQVRHPVPEVWKDALAVNVVAPMLLAQAAGVQMIEQGGGRIVNVASTTGLRGKPFLVPYSTSKGAVVRFTEALAAEWASKNVQVNCIAPGAFVTEAQKAVTESPELHAKRIAKIPAGRMADPSELVPLACLLVSPLSSFTTGAVFVVDGGESGKL